MNFTTYQHEAWRYDQYSEDPGPGLAVALLGLGGEVGDLQTAQKKRVLDGEPRADAQEVATEDVGDVLWYLADAATRLGVSLEEAAANNLTKVAQRWSPHQSGFPYATGTSAGPTTSTRSDPTGRLRLPAPRLFDAAHKAEHRLPRQFEITIAPISPDDQDRVLPVYEGRPCGDRLGDNAYTADNYRFHDAFHLGYAAVLGWSPVFRSISGLKRKDNDIIDDVEDGGRGIAIEEGLSAFLFDEAARSNFYATVRRVSGDALNLCRRLTANLEVRDTTDAEWGAAILAGFDAWRYLASHGIGVLCGDLDLRELSVREPTKAERAVHRRAARKWLKEQEAKKLAQTGR